MHSRGQIVDTRIDSITRATSKALNFTHHPPSNHPSIKGLSRKIGNYKSNSIQIRVTRHSGIYELGGRYESPSLRSTDDREPT